jgi:hypothetical protein
MKRFFLALLCAAGVALMSPGPLSAQDEPGSAVPEPELVTSSWMLTFAYDTPRTIAVEMGDGTVRWYWYMTYEVLNDPRIENNHRDPILFVPEIIIADDRGDIRYANRGINARVFPAIKRAVDNDLLLSPAQVSGNILPGEDFIREGVAIWPVSEDDVDEFTIFFGGLYGETAHLPHPVTGEPMTRAVKDPRTGEPVLDHNGDPVTRPILLRRTRMLHFATPGTDVNPQRQTIRLIEDADVMR